MLLCAGALVGCTGTDLSLDAGGLGLAPVPPALVANAGAEAEAAEERTAAEAGPVASDPTEADVVAAADPGPASEEVTVADEQAIAEAVVTAPVPAVDVAENVTTQDASTEAVAEKAAEVASSGPKAAPAPAATPLVQPDIATGKKRANLLALFTKPKASAKDEDPRRTRRRTRERRAARAAERTELARAPRGERKRKIIRPTKRGAGLPGVRTQATLFGIKRGSNEAAKAFQVASAAGLARRGRNGFVKQTQAVSTECFKPELVTALRRVERHFGRPVIVTSGYRSPKHNRRAGGAKGSKHVTCEAADIQVDGVSRSKIAAFLRSMPDRGGVGTYCHTKSVHYDIGSTRDWSWGCRKRRRR